jgi:hypothetical protein
VSTFKEKVRHAFAVDPPGPAEPTPEQRVPVDWISRQVTKRHLTTPALIALEMCRPLNWLTAQCMHVAEPAVWAIAPTHMLDHYKSLTGFLEQRGSVQYLAQRIEQFEAEHERRKRGADTAPSDEHRQDSFRSS